MWYIHIYIFIATVPAGYKASLCGIYSRFQVGREAVGDKGDRGEDTCLRDIWDNQAVMR